MASQGIVKQARGKPRGFRRDRDCLTCKSRDVKCDLNRPTCTPCLQAGVVCRGYRNKIKWTTTATTAAKTTGGSSRVNKTTKRQPRSSETTPSLSLIQRELCLVERPLHVEDLYNDTNWATHHEMFLEFFESKFERAISSFGLSSPPARASLTSVWKLMQQRVRHDRCLLADGQDVEYLSLRLDALRGVGNAIKDGDIMAIFGVVTLGFLDVYEGPFGDWQGHVSGAEALVKHCCTTNLDLETYCHQIPGLRQLLSLIMWYDLWNVLLNKGRTLFFTDQQRCIMDPEFFGLVDCPMDTFHLFIKIVRGVETGDLPDLQVEISNQLLLLTKDDSNLSSKMRDAWRYSAVMAAFATGKRNQQAPHAPMEQLIKTLGDNICRITWSISPLTGRYRMLSGPLAVLGAISRNPWHMQTVEMYWNVCDSLARPIYPDGRHVRPCIYGKVICV